MTALSDALYGEYMSFFERAEKSRRWSLDDFPWELATRTPHDPTLTLVAEVFCGVEMYLPDYVSSGMNLMRDNFGCAWFTANWAYEESKHALALRHYLVRTGERTEAQIRAYEGHVSSRKWSLPFSSVRQMTLYGALQEMTTFVSYKKQEQAAERVGDELLVAIYRTIGRDEMAHCGFYANAARLMLAEDAEGTKADLAHVFRNFKMPAADLLPEWSTHLTSMQAAGLDRGAFFGEVWLPLLRRLGVTRREITVAGAQAANR